MFTCSLNIFLFNNNVKKYYSIYILYKVGAQFNFIFIDSLVNVFQDRQSNFLKIIHRKLIVEGIEELLFFITSPGDRNVGVYYSDSHVDSSGL